MDQTAKSWYETFFSGVVIDFWREACPPEQTRREVELIERFLAVTAGCRLLDVPCGMGRHLLALAGLGYRVSGVDLSSEAVARIDREPEASPAGVEVVRGDMRSLPWTEEFDGSYCLGNSFGYFNRSGTVLFFSAVSRALKPGRKFLLETSMAAESVLPALDEKHWVRVGETLLLMENDYRVQEGRLDTVYTFVQEERSESRRASHYIYSVSEISSMLSEAGFATLGLFSLPDLEPFQVGSPELLLLAEKQ
jgi:SAM-dependent methyltransferase